MAKTSSNAPTFVEFLGYLEQGLNNLIIWQLFHDLQFTGVHTSHVKAHITVLKL